MILTDATFDDAILPAPLALVMFTAPWAGPANLMRPTYEIAKGRYGNQVDFHEFVVDDNPLTPERFALRKLPLFITFKFGVPLEVWGGTIPVDPFLTIVERLVEGTPV